MPSQSHGRVCLAVALLVLVLFLVFKVQYSARSHNTFAFTTQYAHSSKITPTGIGNDTLGFEKILVINSPWRTDRKDAIALAASYSGISVDFIRGVKAEDMAEKAYPPGKHRQLSDGLKGSWRAHMNALRAIIEKNLTTALIMEDDADWDFRVRSQLSDLSPAVRRLPDLLAQSELHGAKHPPSSEPEQLSQVELAKRSAVSLSSRTDRAISEYTPYGRDWDVLWLGHCGANLPPVSLYSPNRITVLNDPTVPEPQHLKPMANSPLDAIGSLYPPHTRVVHRANTTLCTISYAVTQNGARKLLYEFGIRDFSKGYDFALSDYCNGLTRGSTKETMPTCVVVNPPVFGHYFAERGGSDITGVGIGGKPKTESRYVRWSVRMNLERLVKGQEGIVEQWPDREKNI